jgi:3-oxoacyl-[acyl-carrier-protein] synthase III
MAHTQGLGLGIAAISVYEPTTTLSNDGFAGTLSRKFLHHTGTHSRRISTEDELAMGLRAVANLKAAVPVNLDDCAALIFVSPSFIPIAAGRRLLDPQQVEAEYLGRAAREFTQRLGISPPFAAGINWFCSGYSKAFELAKRVVAARQIQQHQFILVVTASRISRITDFGCTNTGPLFGDLATATLLSPADSQRYPVRFRILNAFAAKEPAPAAYFNFSLRSDTMTASADGRQNADRDRVVYSLDGQGIAEAAPRAMARAVARALAVEGLAAEAVRHVVPHQAGTGIVRFTQMKLDQLGIRGEVLNGITGEVGNVSSSSVPYALNHAWNRLEGIIACPTAAVGSPGKAEVSSGCILLESPSARASQKKTA